MSLFGWCTSSHKASHEWLDTLWKENRTNKRNKAPSLKTITAANKKKNCKLAKAATVLLFTAIQVKTRILDLLHLKRVKTRMMPSSWQQWSHFTVTKLVFPLSGKFLHKKRNNFPNDKLNFISTWPLWCHMTGFPPQPRYEIRTLAFLISIRSKIAELSRLGLMVRKFLCKLCGKYEICEFPKCKQTI